MPRKRASAGTSWAGTARPWARHQTFFRTVTSLAAGSALHRDTPEARFDLNYTDHNASNRPVATGQQSPPVQIDGGNASFWSASGNLAYYVPFFGDFICDP